MKLDQEILILIAGAIIAYIQIWGKRTIAVLARVQHTRDNTETKRTAYRLRFIVMTYV